MLAGKAGGERLRSEIQTAVEQRQEFLCEIVDASREFTETLDSLDQAEQQLINEVDEFTTFINERVLWMRSHPPLNHDSVRGDKLAMLWLLGASLPAELAATLVNDVTANPSYWLLAGLATVVALLRARRLRRMLREYAKTAQRSVTTSMKPTLLAWCVTVLISLSWPGLVLFVAWRLEASDSSTMQAFANGMMQLGIVFLVLEFFRQSCRPMGLAHAHFDWPDRTILLLRRTFRGLIVVALPAALIVAVLRAREAESSVETDAIEMLAFAITMAILLFFAHRLFRPRVGLFQDWIAYHQGGWIDRGQHVIYLSVLAIPVYLIGQTVLGYYYTAQHILEKAELTAWLILSAVFLRSILSRALTLRRRRLAFEQLRQRQTAAQGTSDEFSEGATSNLPEVQVEQNSDLGQVSRQALKVLNTTLCVAAFAGLWLVWDDVLPALNYLDNWELWKTTYTVVEETPRIDGTAGFTERLVTEPISIVDLVAAVLIGLLTLTATRNIPGLLEITLLERLPLDPSVRYATTAISRYLIILLGVVSACRTVGIGWDHVQWLAAALTFGLAFGLQEVFANFVSGIIILFEQPVRVGDVVTLDTVSGVVSRIRIRSTTITDWDRKDYIVPNKEFITGRLLNWTLSDTTNRVIVNVGVAYGTDANRVLEVIHRVATEHPVVLEDPPPLVTFESFGDSSLNFVLRAYLPNLDNRLLTISELHTTIHNDLARAGIEIPFPQRDLHVRSLPAAVFGTDRSSADESRSAA